jgi:hypothetical protein
VNAFENPATLVTTAVWAKYGPCECGSAHVCKLPVVFKTVYTFRPLRAVRGLALRCSGVPEKKSGRKSEIILSEIRA